MQKTVNYKTKGVCSREIHLTVNEETGVVEAIEFVGGCHGNTQGVASLATGMTVDEIIRKTEGIRCGMKQTSCPDQLATALKLYKAENA